MRVIVIIGYRERNIGYKMIYSFLRIIYSEDVTRFPHVILLIQLLGVKPPVKSHDGGESSRDESYFYVCCQYIPRAVIF